VEPFLKAEPKPSWNGEELLIMTKYYPSLKQNFSLIILYIDKSIATRK
jgi:hypothetical protein